MPGPRPEPEGSSVPATNDVLAGKLSAKEALAQYAARVNAKFQELGLPF
jgi:hypothetical protein